VSRLDEVGDRDGWRCWLCDEAVDATMSVNDARGPSIDSVTTRAKARGPAPAVGTERLAHRACNTKKGAITAVVPWPAELFVVDPAPILGTVERLARKRGRDVMARCPTEADARAAGDWLVDRIARLIPGLAVEATAEPGGGQYLVVLTTR
jgi:hypothetical protein